MPIVLVQSAPSDIGLSSGTDFVATTNTSLKAPTVSHGINMPSGCLGRGMFSQAVDSSWTSFFAFTGGGGLGASFQYFHYRYNAFPFSFTGGWYMTINASLGVDYGMRIYANIGGSWVQIGESVGILLANNLYRYDIRHRYHATEGLFQVYVDGALIFEYTGDTTWAGGGYNGYRLQSSVAGGGTTPTMSAHIVATADTRVFKVHSMAMTGQGALAEWDGAYTNINKVTINDATYVNSLDIGDVSTYTFTKPAIPAGDQVGAIVLNTRASHYGTLTNGVTTVSYDGTDVVDLRALPNVDVPYFAIPSITEINPATGARFTPEEYAILEFGFKST